MDSSDKSQLTTKQVANTGRTLVIILVALGIISVGGVYMLASHPKFIASSKPGNEAIVTPVPPERPKKCGLTGLAFSNTSSQTHYFRDNKEAGKILIITGLVHHSYPDPHSFIKVRGILSGGEGKVLADRFIYAGNILTEVELATKPILEIQSLLNSCSGQGNLNANIKPNIEIPFMVVFDEIPQGMEGYRIEVVGSELAEPEQHQDQEKE